MKAAACACLLAVAIATSGCATGPKQGIGAVGGAVAGGVLGSMLGGGTGKLVAVGVGTLLGAFAGSEIGASLDRADAAALDRASQQAFRAPVGEPVRWNNPRSGHSGTIQPISDETLDRRSGGYCREYQSTVHIGGRVQQAFGTACRMPDGTWRILDRR